MKETEKASDTGIRRGRDARLPVFSRVLYGHQQMKMKERDVLKCRRAPGASPMRCTLG